MRITDETYNIGPFESKPDDDLIVCRCEEITKGEVRRAIHDGMYTMNEVKRYLRSGMGLCQGQTCGKIIRKIIADELGISQKEVGIITSRAPARPVTMGVYARDTFDSNVLGGDKDGEK